MGSGYPRRPHRPLSRPFHLQHGVGQARTVQLSQEPASTSSTVGDGLTGPTHRQRRANSRNAENYTVMQPSAARSLKDSVASKLLAEAYTEAVAGPWVRRKHVVPGWGAQAK
jgi:hypothetical protein